MDLSKLKKDTFQATSSVDIWSIYNISWQKIVSGFWSILADV